jgi:hypothetical protein
MKTDLNHEQMMTIVERARYQRSVAAGQIIVATSGKALTWLAKLTDRLLHAFMVSPTARQ